MNKKIPFSPPRIDDLIIDSVVDTLKSGWITTGPKTKLFEKKLQELTTSRKVLCLNSATAGLELMLRWYGVGNEDEVIIPAYTYSATANVIIHCGAKPVMVDSGDDFNMSVQELRKYITPKTKVIMPVDIGGVPCDYNEIMNIVNEEGVKNMFEGRTNAQKNLGRILILADAAHSIGSIYESAPAAIAADVAVFSFHAVKNLTTAEGGAICLNLPSPFNLDEIYTYLNTISLHGQNKDALAKFKKGGWKYDIIEAGYKCNMTDIMASIGLVEIERYADTLKVRMDIVKRYDEFFSKYNWHEKFVYKTDNKLSSAHLYMLRIKGITEDQRDRIIELISEKEVAVNVHFRPLPLHSYYKGLGYKMSDYPVAFDLYSREISLPVYYSLNEEDQAYACEVIADAVDKIIV